MSINYHSIEHNHFGATKDQIILLLFNSNAVKKLQLQCLSRNRAISNNYINTLMKKSSPPTSNSPNRYKTLRSQVLKIRGNSSGNEKLRFEGNAIFRTLLPNRRFVEERFALLSTMRSNFILRAGSRFSKVTIISFLD